MAPPLPVAEVVDVDSLWRSIAASIAAGVGITATFALAMLGWIRARHAWDGETRARALGWSAICALASIAFIGAIVLGLIAMSEQ